MTDNSRTDERNPFADYVTSTAFSISLSRPMCEAMEFFRFEEIAGRGWVIVSTIPAITTMHSLHRRGLVEKYENEKGQRNQRMTQAGLLLYPLLALAGLVRSEEQLRELAARGRAA